jgi:hypothetical protein
VFYSELLCIHALASRWYVLGLGAGRVGIENIILRPRFKEDTETSIPNEVNPGTYRGNLHHGTSAVVLEWRAKA